MFARTMASPRGLELHNVYSIYQTGRSCHPSTSNALPEILFPRIKFYVHTTTVTLSPVKSHGSLIATEDNQNTRIRDVKD